MPVIPHGRLKDPSPNDIVWRYMTLSKFKDLIDRSQLYFCSLDKYDNDPMEGVVPEKNYAPDFKTPVLVTDLTLIPTSDPTKFTVQNNSGMRMIPLKDHYGNNYEREVKANKEHDLQKRKAMFVNCWHKNTSESEAFWRIYTDPNEPTVAIKTTVRDLVKAFPRDKSYLFISDVLYYDENDSIPTGNDLYQVIHKRKQFEYEKEVRLIYWSGLKYNELAPGSMNDSRIDVDLKTLIPELWISPRASDKDYEDIQAIIKKAGLSPTLKRSTVLKKPVV